MATSTGVACRMFKALADAEINIQMITTSEIKISVLVSRDQSLAALRAVHHEFQLDLGITATKDFDFDPSVKSAINAVEVIDRLQQVGMESLMIDDILLDESQARITLARVPNQPGIAAAIFGRVADKEIFVDMIVQIYAHDQYADISFNVPQNQCESATDVARGIQKQFGCKAVHSRNDIAKLTVSGIGLHSHTGVALGTFQALADAAINVEMINTSEVRINIVVDAAQGRKGLVCL
jgi:aspartate kinase